MLKMLAPALSGLALVVVVVAGVHGLERAESARSADARGDCREVGKQRLSAVPVVPERTTWRCADGTIYWR
jgi:hypothetical protein